MNKRFKDIAAGIAFGIVLSAGVYQILAKPVDAQDLPKGQGLPFTPMRLAIIKQTKAMLETYQIDAAKEGTIDENKMFYGAMKGLVESIDDPYTRFVNPKNLEEEQMQIEGEYGGLGMYIATKDGRTVVISPIEGTPADRAGIKPLDEIVKVGDDNVYGWQSDEVAKKLRGRAGAAVKVTIRRKDAVKLQEFNLKREIIKIKTVRMEMDGNVAYIKINNFNQKTDGELAAAISQAKKAKAKGILLDLRNNPGGLLDSVVDVTAQFIDGGVVVRTKGRFEQANHTYGAERGRANKLPVVVLVNEGSASAAEILAGALKDHKRATVVGMKTFGKGSVQSLFSLPDKSGIFITIARYTTPNGTQIDHKGLEPHIRMGGELTKEKSKDKQYVKGLAILKKDIASNQK